MMTTPSKSAIGSVLRMSMAFALMTATVLAGGGHLDVDIKVVNEKLTTEGGGETNILAGGVFFDADGMVPVPVESVYSTTYPGFDALAGTFTPGAQVRFDFVQQLLYWNGTELVDTNANLTVSFGANSQTISGSDTSGLPGFVLGQAILSGQQAGGFHSDLEWTLPETAASGLYGVVLRLSMESGSPGPVISPSESFLLAFGKGDVIDVDRGLEAMATVAAVPEPSSMVLAGLGVAGVLAAGWRRRRRAAGRNSTATEIAG